MPDQQSGGNYIKKILKGVKINIITRAAEYSKLINQPNHITKDYLVLTWFLHQTLT